MLQTEVTTTAQHRGRNTVGRLGLRSSGICLTGLVSAMLLLLVALPATAKAIPPFFTDFGDSGDVATGQVNLPRGVGANPANGEVFVSDQSHRRINVYSAWGEFRRTFGWNVVATGPNDTAADELETCVPADGDSCKAGIAGSGAGQLDLPQGLRLDSAGDVYVVDAPNRRIQKFSPDGEFVLMFGGGVNQTTGANVCTAQDLDDGDTCGAGAIGTGPGEFDAFPSASASGGNALLAVSSSDDVYVGGTERIQRFNSSGVFQDEIDLTGSFAGLKVGSLDIDSAGDLYATFVDPSAGASGLQPDIRKLDSSGSVLETLAVSEPRTVTVGPEDDVYVYASNVSGNDGDEPPIRRFASDGSLVEAFGLDFATRLAGVRSVSSSGIAVSPVTADGDLAIYISRIPEPIAPENPPLVRAYSPVPDESIAGPPPSVAPTISDSFASAVGTATATVNAEINPAFWDDTTYQVQYGTEGPCSAHPCESVPASPELLTSEVVNADRPAEVALADLDPATTYHYRFTAVSSGGGPVFGPDLSFTIYPAAPPAQTDCPNQVFRIDLGGLLPDCRAYEMVSPVDKNGGDVRSAGNISSVEQFYPQVTPDGDKLTYSSLNAFADPEGAPIAVQYLADRGTDGWHSDAITPARETNIPSVPAELLNNTFVGFTEALSHAWLVWDGEPPLDPAAPTGYRMPYRRDNGSGAFAPLQTVTPPTATPGAGGDDSFWPRIAGFASDGQSAVLIANDRLLAEASTATDSFGHPIRQLYEWREGQGLRLVSRLPGTNAASGQPSTLGTLHADLESPTGKAANAVSEDGSVIWWTTAPANPQNGGALYARVDGAQTVEVSGEVTASAASFQAARPDGTAALFTANSRLYLFDLEEALDSGPDPATEIATGVTGMIAASEDLSSAYLISTELLDLGPNSEDDFAQAGQQNVFHWQAGDGFTFVAALEGEFATATLGAAATPLAKRTSRATADGSHLVFMSRRPLTGSDSTDARYGRANAQVFHYSAVTGELACVSCNPAGARPQGAARGVVGRGSTSDWRDMAGLIPGHLSHSHASRLLSEDGQSVFFESFDSLLPRDTNGVRDVYQWQAPGSGSCDTDNSNPGPLYFAANKGCLALISTGKGSNDADFVDATPNGSSTFFRTDESLVPQDTGLTDTDIYAARVDGGFEPPPPHLDPCEGDACRGNQSDPPATVSPETEKPGLGNPPQVRDCAPLARRARGARQRARGQRQRAKRLRQRAKRQARQGNAARAKSARQRARRVGRRARAARQRANRLGTRARRCRETQAEEGSER